MASKGGRCHSPTVWCQDCEQLLCLSCDKQHKLADFTNYHHVIPYNEYQNLPPIILKTKLNCTSHHQTLTEFCRIHDELICIKCREQFHKNCTEVAKIDDIVDSVKYSARFESTFAELNTICGTLKTIADDRTDNLQQLQNMRQKIEENLNNKIDTFIHHLNNLKDSAMSDIDSLCYEITSEISNTSQLTQSKEKELRDVLEQKDAIRSHASNQQTFMAIKQMEQIMHDTSATIQELDKCAKLQRQTIFFDNDEGIKDIVFGIKSLGKVRITRSTSVIAISNANPAVAQADVHTTSPIQLHFQKKIEVFKEEQNDFRNQDEYTGCCTLPSGLMVFTNAKKHTLCIHKPNGSIKSTIKFRESEGIFDVTLVDDLHIAVSHPKSNTISIISLKNKIVVKTLHMSHTISKLSGLCCRGRDIVCCVKGKGLVRINIDSAKVDTVVNDETGDSYVAFRNNMLCYTRYVRDEKSYSWFFGFSSNLTVTVLNDQYNVIFNHSCPKLTGLTRPSGLTIDEHGYTYIVSSYRVLLVISPDGKSCHQIR